MEREPSCKVSQVMELANIRSITYVSHAVFIYVIATSLFAHKTFLKTYESMSYTYAPEVLRHCKYIFDLVARHFFLFMSIANTALFVTETRNCMLSCVHMYTWYCGTVTYIRTLETIFSVRYMKLIPLPTCFE